MWPRVDAIRTDPADGTITIVLETASGFEVRAGYEDRDEARQMLRNEFGRALFSLGDPIARPQWATDGMSGLRWSPAPIPDPARSGRVLWLAKPDGDPGGYRLGFDIRTGEAELSYVSPTGKPRWIADGYRRLDAEDARARALPLIAADMARLSGSLSSAQYRTGENPADQLLAALERPLSAAPDGKWDGRFNPGFSDAERMAHQVGGVPDSDWGPWSGLSAAEREAIRNRVEFARNARTVLRRVAKALGNEHGKPDVRINAGGRLSAPSASLTTDRVELHVGVSPALFRSGVGQGSPYLLMKGRLPTAAVENLSEPAAAAEDRKPGRRTRRQKQPLEITSYRHQPDPFPNQDIPLDLLRHPEELAARLRQEADRANQIASSRMTGAEQTQDEQKRVAALLTRAADMEGVPAYGQQGRSAMARRLGLLWAASLPPDLLEPGTSTITVSSIGTIVPPGMPGPDGRKAPKSKIAVHMDPAIAGPNVGRFEFSPGEIANWRAGLDGSPGPIAATMLAARLSSSAEGGQRSWSGPAGPVTVAAAGARLPELPTKVPKGNMAVVFERRPPKSANPLVTDASPIKKATAESWRVPSWSARQWSPLLTAAADLARKSGAALPVLLDPQGFDIAAGGAVGSAQKRTDLVSAVPGQSGPRILVVSACSKSKLDTAEPVPAGSLYTGSGHRRLVQSLDEARASGVHVEHWVVSAEHGLVHADRPIATYDRELSPEDIPAWRDRTFGHRELARLLAADGYDRAIIALPQTYRKALSLVDADAVFPTLVLTGPEEQEGQTGTGMEAAPVGRSFARSMKWMDRDAKSGCAGLLAKAAAGRIEASEAKALEATGIPGSFLRPVDRPASEQRVAVGISAGDRVTTPGTRIQWASLSEWLDGAADLASRPPTSEKYRKLEAHVRALTLRPELIERESEASVLTRLGNWLKTGLDPVTGRRANEILRYPRGQRHGTGQEALVVAANNRLARLGAQQFSLGSGPYGEIEQWTDLLSDFQRVMSNYTDAREAARDFVIAMGSQLGGVEVVVALDNSGAPLAAGTSWIVDGVNLPEKLQLIAQDRANRIELHHNHPSDVPLSYTDLQTLERLPGLVAIAAYGPSGAMSVARTMAPDRPNLADCFKQACMVALPAYSAVRSGGPINLLDCSAPDGVDEEVFLRETGLRALVSAGLIDYGSDYELGVPSDAEAGVIALVRGSVAGLAGDAPEQAPGSYSLGNHDGYARTLRSAELAFGNIPVAEVARELPQVPRRASQEHPGADHGAPSGGRAGLPGDHTGGSDLLAAGARSGAASRSGSGVSAPQLSVGVTEPTNPALPTPQIPKSFLKGLTPQARTLVKNAVERALAPDHWGRRSFGPNLAPWFARKTFLLQQFYSGITRASHVGPNTDLAFAKHRRSLARWLDAKAHGDAQPGATNQRRLFDWFETAAQEYAAAEILGGIDARKGARRAAALMEHLNQLRGSALEGDNIGDVAPGSLKKQFQTAARSFLGGVAADLGLEKTEYKVKASAGGPAVAGEVALEHPRIRLTVSGDAYLAGLGPLLAEAPAGAFRQWLQLDELRTQYPIAIARISDVVARGAALEQQSWMQKPGDELLRNGSDLRQAAEAAARQDAGKSYTAPWTRSMAAYAGGFHHGFRNAAGAGLDRAGAVDHNRPAFARGEAAGREFYAKMAAQAGVQFSLGDPPARLPWPKDFPPVIFHSRLQRLKEHPDYIAAKDGDTDAAERVIRDLVHPERVAALREAIDPANLPIIIPVVSERVGIQSNAIPEAFAEYLSQALNLPVEDRIIGATRGGHTGAEGWVRVADRPRFEGPVEHGRSYWIVDDNVTLGTTIAELRAHIEQGGGVVTRVSTLTAGRNGHILAPTIKATRELQQRFGVHGHRELEEFWREHAGYSLAGLTAAETRLLSEAGSVDAIRARLGEAAKQVAARATAREVQGHNTSEIAAAVPDTDGLRLLVCGGRFYRDRDALFSVLDAIHAKRPIALIIEGEAGKRDPTTGEILAGADLFARAWAESRGVVVAPHKANWLRHGYAAGPMRNADMIAEGQPHAVLGFPGGRGTADMMRQARNAGLPVIDVRDYPPPLDAAAAVGQATQFSVAAPPLLPGEQRILPSILRQAVEQLPDQMQDGRSWLGRIANLPGVPQEAKEWFARYAGLAHERAYDRSDILRAVDRVLPTLQLTEFKGFDISSDLVRFEADAHSVISAPDEETKRCLRITNAAEAVCQESQDGNWRILGSAHSAAMNPAGSPGRQPAWVLEGWSQRTQDWRYVASDSSFEALVHIANGQRAFLSPADRSPARVNQAALYSEFSAPDWGAGRNEGPLAEITGYREWVIAWDGAPLPYISHHWPTVENPLLHLRLSDRLMADGRTFLHIEEVQSDWHQDQRPQETDVSRARAALEAMGIQDMGVDTPWFEDQDGKAVLFYPDARVVEPDSERLATADELKHIQVLVKLHEQDGMKPDAPLEGEWSRLGLGLALQQAMAVTDPETGRPKYDGLSWSDGYTVAHVLNAYSSQSVTAVDWAVGPDMSIGMSLVTKQGPAIPISAVGEMPGWWGEAVLEPSRTSTLWQDLVPVLAGTGGQPFHRAALTAASAIDKAVRNGLRSGRVPLPEGTEASLPKPGLVAFYDRRLPRDLARLLPGVAADRDAATGWHRVDFTPLVRERIRAMPLTAYSLGEVIGVLPDPSITLNGTGTPGITGVATMPALTLDLAARGNPDFGQADGPLPGVPASKVEVADLSTASSVALAYIREHDLGGGNWAGGLLTDAEGEVVGRVGYSGKVWPPGEITRDAVPLYVPPEQRQFRLPGQNEPMPPMVEASGLVLRAVSEAVAQGRLPQDIETRAALVHMTALTGYDAGRGALPSLRDLLSASPLSALNGEDMDRARALIVQVPEPSGPTGRQASLPASTAAMMAVLSAGAGVGVYKWPDPVEDAAAWAVQRFERGASWLQEHGEGTARELGTALNRLFGAAPTTILQDPETSSAWKAERLAEALSTSSIETMDPTVAAARGAAAALDPAGNGTTVDVLPEVGGIISESRIQSGFDATMLPDDALDFVDRVPDHLTAQMGGGLERMRARLADVAGQDLVAIAPVDNTSSIASALRPEFDAGLNTTSVPLPNLSSSLETLRTGLPGEMNATVQATLEALRVHAEASVTGPGTVSAANRLAEQIQALEMFGPEGYAAFADALLASQAMSAGPQIDPAWQLAIAMERFGGLPDQMIDALNSRAAEVIHQLSADQLFQVFGNVNAVLSEMKAGADLAAKSHTEAAADGISGISPPAGAAIDPADLPPDTIRAALKAGREQAGNPDAALADWLDGFFPGLKQSAENGANSMQPDLPPTFNPAMDLALPDAMPVPEPTSFWEKLVDWARDTFSNAIPDGASVSEQLQSGVQQVAATFGHLASSVQFSVGEAPDRTVELIYMVRSFEDPDRLAAIARAPGAHDARDRWERTALHYAADGDNLPALRILLDAGFDPNARSVWNSTPLHYAASRGVPEAARMLLAAGADPMASDKAGLTPAAIAEIKGPEMARMFKSQPQFQVGNRSIDIGAKTDRRTNQEGPITRRLRDALANPNISGIDAGVAAVGTAAIVGAAKLASMVQFSTGGDRPQIQWNGWPKTQSALVLLPWERGGRITGTTVAVRDADGVLYGARDIMFGDKHDRMVDAWVRPAQHDHIPVHDERPAEYRSAAMVQYSVADTSASVDLSPAEYRDASDRIRDRFADQGLALRGGWSKEVEADIAAAGRTERPDPALSLDLLEQTIGKHMWSDEHKAAFAAIMVDERAPGSAEHVNVPGSIVLLAQSAAHLEAAAELLSLSDDTIGTIRSLKERLSADPAPVGEQLWNQIQSFQEIIDLPEMDPHDQWPTAALEAFDKAALSAEQGLMLIGADLDRSAGQAREEMQAQLDVLRKSMARPVDGTTIAAPEDGQKASFATANAVQEGGSDINARDEKGRNALFHLHAIDPRLVWATAALGAAAAAAGGAKVAHDAGLIQFKADAAVSLPVVQLDPPDPAPDPDRLRRYAELVGGAGNLREIEDGDLHSARPLVVQRLRTGDGHGFAYGEAAQAIVRAATSVGLPVHGDETAVTVPLAGLPAIAAAAGRKGMILQHPEDHRAEQSWQKAAMRALKPALANAGPPAAAAGLIGLGLWAASRVPTVQFRTATDHVAEAAAGTVLVAADGLAAVQKARDVADSLETRPLSVAVSRVPDQPGQMVLALRYESTGSADLADSALRTRGYRTTRLGDADASLAFVPPRQQQEGVRAEPLQEKQPTSRLHQASQQAVQSDTSTGEGMRLSRFALPGNRPAALHSHPHRSAPVGAVSQATAPVDPAPTRVQEQSAPAGTAAPQSPGPQQSPSGPENGATGGALPPLEDARKAGALAGAVTGFAAGFIASQAAAIGPSIQFKQAETTTVLPQNLQPVLVGEGRKAMQDAIDALRAMSPQDRASRRIVTNAYAVAPTTSVDHAAAAKRGIEALDKAAQRTSRRQGLGAER